MSLFTKKCQDLNVSVYFDQLCILWVSADDVLSLLRLPSSSLQTIQQRHKKCWIDFRCQSQCSHDSSKLFIDLYGLGNLCNRVNSQISDYLMTLFVAEVYLEKYRECRRSPSPRHKSPSPRRRSRSRCRSPSPRRRSRSPRCCPHHHHHHHNQNQELLERVARQNDTILNNLNQLTVNNANQHLELSNVLNAIRLQNVNIAAQIAQILDIVENQLGGIGGDIERLLTELDARFTALTNALTTAIAQLSDQLRNELTNINSILNNLTSSVTNINATLNNLLQAINGLDIGDLITDLTATINTILTQLETILGILNPNLPLGGKKQQSLV
ncbi:PEP [Mythimna sequax nucleopolyhedrovirus]|nr:PEP [Mythimna sequax nucleopolyhedrovirus]